MRDVFDTDLQPFDVSVRDFRTRANAFGWPFWRGVLVGFAAAFPIAYVAIVGESFFGLGS